MSVAACVLVLTAAVAHAAWNLLLKRSGGGTAFVWLFASLSSVLDEGDGLRRTLAASGMVGGIVCLALG